MSVAFGERPPTAGSLGSNTVNLCLSFAENTAKCRIALRLLFATTVAHMSDGTHLTTWVTRETKERFAAVARHQGLSDSALLKRLVDLMLQSASAAESGKIRGCRLGLSGLTLDRQNPSRRSVATA